MFKEEVVFIFVLVLFVAFCCDKMAHSAEQETSLWLARSCVGEAGWSAHSSSECAAILHIYRKRAELTKRDILTIAKMYSAAIKFRHQRKNKWVLHLNKEGTRPKHFPKNLSWKNFKQDWLATLSVAEKFLAGEIADPLPSADHYGSRVDAWRAIRAGWIRVKAPYRNQFWRVPKSRKTSYKQSVTLQGEKI